MVPPDHAIVGRLFNFRAVAGVGSIGRVGRFGATPFFPEDIVGDEGTGSYLPATGTSRFRDKPDTRADDMRSFYLFPRVDTLLGGNGG